MPILRSLAVPLALLVPVCVASGGAATAGEDPPPIDQAIARAKGAGHPLIVEFGTTWCKPCAMFDKDILPDAKVQESLAGVDFVRYDAEIGPGIKAAARYGVNSFPTFLAVDGGGEVRGRTSGIETGPTGVTQFVKFVTEARQAVREEDGIRADLARSPDDPAVRLAAARWYGKRARNQEALANYDAAVAISSAPAEVRGEARAEAARIRRLDAWHKQLVAEKAELLRSAPGTPGASAALRIAAIGSGLPDKEVRALCGAAIAGTSSPSDLNDLLYIALAAGAKDEAVIGAKKLRDLQPKDASALDTVAEVYFSAGQRDEALRIEDEAVALAKGTPVEAGLAKNRERFASGGAESDDVKRERKTAAGIWTRLEKLDSGVSDGPAEMPPQIQEMQAFMGAARRVAGDAGKACADKAGKLDEAYVRLYFGDAEGPPKDVTVLEPGATPALKKCLTQSLKRLAFPKAPAMFNGKQVVSVRLAK